MSLGILLYGLAFGRGFFKQGKSMSDKKEMPKALPKEVSEIGVTKVIDMLLRLKAEGKFKKGGVACVI